MNQALYAHKNNKRKMKKKKECLPSKHEVLNSNSTATKKKKTPKNKNNRHFTD
jgi:hypothetical protein